ncbi:bacteriophytochrome, partial [Pseudomonas syringae pv. actinidiae ICMP 19096]
DPEILQGLVSRPELLQTLTLADGAAVLIDDRVHLFGQCPTAEEVRALYQWIRDAGLTRQRSKERATGLQG